MSGSDRHEERNVSRKIVSFIKQHVSSVSELEVLLLSYAESQRGWTAQTVAQELRTTTDLAKRHLNKLENHQILIYRNVDNQECFYFEPKDPDVQAVVADLAVFYNSHRLRIIDLIYAPKEDALAVFADAFRFRKDD